MISKTTCPHCGLHIEFDVENLGRFAPCPSCGKEVQLMVSVANPADKIGTPPFQRPKAKAARVDFMKIALVAVSILCTVFIITTVLLFNENRQAKGEIQKLNAQSKAVEEKMAGAQKDEVTEYIIDHVTGIYSCNERSSGQTDEMDIRSDMTAQTWFRYRDYYDLRLSLRNVVWKVTTNGVSVNGKSFRYESGDLIDSRAMGWL